MMNTTRKSKKNSLIKKNFTINTHSFNQTFSVLDQGHFVRPSRHFCLTSDKYQILCQGQGKDGLQIASHVASFLQASVKHLVNQQSKLNKMHSQEASSQLNKGQVSLNLYQNQRYMILNLIDSCFQDLSNKNYQGSCCFCLAYLIGKQLFIVKNSQINVFLVIKSMKQGKNKYELKNIESSQESKQNKNNQEIDNNQLQKKLFSKSHKINNQQKWFFSCNKKYEDIIRSKYFPSLHFFTQKISDQNSLISNSLQTYLLLGSTQCFFHFDQKSLLSYFSPKKKLENLEQDDKNANYKVQVMQQKNNKSSTQKICKQIIKECRKQWKTIYQHDISLITSKIK